MIRPKHYWEDSSTTIKRISLALKGFIAAIATNAYFTNDPKTAFWFMIAGAALDTIINCLPPGDNGSNGNGIKAMAVMFILFAFSGCSVIKPGTDYSKKDTTIINYKIIDVPVKGANVGTGVNLDSMYKAAIQIRGQYLKDSLAAALAGKPAPAAPKQLSTFTDPETKAQLTYWIDQYGKLQIGCESKDQVLKLLAAEITRLSKEVTKKTEVVKETPVWNQALIIALSALLGLSLLFNYKNR